MLTLIAAGLLSVAAMHSEWSTRCTMAVDRFTPPSDAPVVVLRASRDSALAGHYVTAGSGLRRVDPSSANTFSRAVYGQKMDLLAVEGPDAVRLAAAKRAVVIWWTIAPSCTQYYPSSATRIATGEVFILARVRPVAEWVDSTPTFDVRHQDWVYAPSEFRPRTPGRNAMNMSEYRAFFRLLPTSQQPTPAVRQARRRLLAWADSNPVLAAKFPANDTMCFVRLLDGGSRDCFEK